MGGDVEGAVGMSRSDIPCCWRCDYLLNELLVKMAISADLAYLLLMDESLRDDFGVQDGFGRDGFAACFGVEAAVLAGAELVECVECWDERVACRDVFRFQVDCREY